LENVRVTNYDGRTITTNLVFDATVIWTAGVQGAVVAGLNADALVEKVERIRVNEFSQVKGYEDILHWRYCFDGKS
jgi:NADH dehydrogenase